MIDVQRSVDFLHSAFPRPCAEGPFLHRTCVCNGPRYKTGGINKGVKLGRACACCSGFPLKAGGINVSGFREFLASIVTPDLFRGPVLTVSVNLAALIWIPAQGRYDNLLNLKTTVR